MKQHSPLYLLRLAEQEMMEMWVILHRLQQRQFVTVSTFAATRQGI